MANTVFLKKVHALAMLPNKKTLIEQDHAEEWHGYFENKEVSYVSKNRPVYLRVLSPTSITSTTGDVKSYAQYLDSFGDWLTPMAFSCFKESLTQLEKVHLEFYPDGKYESVKLSLGTRVVKKLKRLLKPGS